MILLIFVTDSRRNICCLNSKSSSPLLSSPAVLFSTWNWSLPERINCHPRTVASFAECFLIYQFHHHLSSLVALLAVDQSHLYAWNWQWHGLNWVSLSMPTSSTVLCILHIVYIVSLFFFDKPPFLPFPLMLILTISLLFCFLNSVSGE